jgi:energy-coupling factor transporter transmembrane protein EcfT
VGAISLAVVMMLIILAFLVIGPRLGVAFLAVCGVLFFLAHIFQ